MISTESAIGIAIGFGVAYGIFAFFKAEIGGLTVSIAAGNDKSLERMIEAMVKASQAGS